MGNDFLIWLKGKVEQFNTLADEEKIAHKKHDDIVNTIRSKYENRRANERARFKAIMDSLNKEEKFEIEVVPPMDFDDTVMNATSEEILTAQKEFLEKYKVDHEMMCKLLSEETKLKWKPIEISGKFNDPVFGINMYSYGIALVNEHRPEFLLEELNNYYGNIKDNENMIICANGGCNHHSARKEAQDEANAFNWLRIFLRENNLYPNNVEVSNLPRLNMNRQLVKTVLNKYVSSLNLNFDTEPENSNI